MKKVFLGMIVIGVALLAKESQLHLEYIGKVQGPFNNTSIEKYKDTSNGVVCYLYVPDSVGTESSFSEKEVHHKIVTFAGNISCVKEKTWF